MRRGKEGFYVEAPPHSYPAGVGGSMSGNPVSSKIVALRPPGNIEDEPGRREQLVDVASLSVCLKGESRIYYGTGMDKNAE